MAPRIRYPVPNLTQRYAPRYHTPIHRDADAIDWGATHRPHDFEVTNVNFEGNPEEDALWQFQHVLGRGGYGLVGLWTKKNEWDEVLDNMAVKEMPYPRRCFQFERNGPDIPEEAIIQVDLQKKGCVPVLQMRGLSVLTAPPGHRPKMRYYLEYCAHGSLRGVIKNHHNLIGESPHSVQNVPEPFLWQLLYNFAQVMLAMESPPYDHPAAQYLTHNPFILHLDVKLDNIMLSEPDDDDIVWGYPACKVGDWGLAVLTDDLDDINSDGLKSRGTRRWYPPEQWERNGFGRNWQSRRPWQQNNEDDYPYTPAHSVFAFASVIFRLMVLDRDSTRLESLLLAASQHEYYVVQKGYKLITSNEMEVNTLGQPTRYSPLLKDTIAACLHFDPNARPDATYLERIAHDVCTSYATDQFQRGYNTLPVLHSDQPGAQHQPTQW